MGRLSSPQQSFSEALLCPQHCTRLGTLMPRPHPWSWSAPAEGGTDGDSTGDGVGGAAGSRVAMRRPHPSLGAITEMRTEPGFKKRR